MASTPNFFVNPTLGVAAISTANANRDGTGTLGVVLTAGASHQRIRRISIQALAATIPGMVRLFLHDGTTAHLLREVLVEAATPGASAKAFAQEFAEGFDNTGLVPFVLPNGWSLRASTHNADSFKVFAEGATL